MESENNSKHELTEALRKAASGNARSKVARLREVFDEVEAARAAGVSHKKIVEALASRGLEFDLGTFEITRYRISKERKAGILKSVQEKEINLKKRKQDDSDTNVAASQEIAIKPAVNNSNKNEWIAPELEALALKPDLSLDDEIYEQFRKKD